MERVTVTHNRPHALQGWTEASPGHVFWYAPFRSAEKPQMLLGTEILAALAANPSPTPAAAAAGKGGMPTAVRCHAISHRYAKLKETARDKLTCVDPPTRPAALLVGRSVGRSVGLYTLLAALAGG